MLETIFELSPCTLVNVKLTQEFSDFYGEFDYKQAAIDLIDSLDDKYCDAFIEALRNHCDEILWDSKVRSEEISKLYRKIK